MDIYLREKKPEETERPEKPGKPESPESPESPERPARPETPGKPGKPGKPESPEGPEGPKKPVKEKKPRYNAPVWLTAVVLFLLSIGMGIEVLYFGSISSGAGLLGYLLSKPLLLLLNMLPAMLLVYLGWFASGRAWVGALAGGILALGWSCAEYWKLMARSEPIYAEDLKIAGEAAEMTGRYISVTWQQILALVLLAAVVTALLLFFRSKPGIPVVRGILSAITVLMGVEAWMVLYQNNTLYNSFPVYEEMAEWADSSQYLSRGGLYPFLHGLAESGEDQNQDQTSVSGTDQQQWGGADSGSGAENNIVWSEDLTPQEILAQFQDDGIADGQKVSVVCVMLEAMADFSKYTNVISAADPYVQYHEMEAESYSGELVTNIFAGNTINTERSVITGFSELGDFTTPSWSYARYFLDQGYQVSGAHAGEADYYNRQTVNKNLGFPSYRFEENYYYQLVDGRPWDDVFLPDITATVVNDVQDGPVFSYNVTYQNHGPYETNVRYFDTEYVPEDAVSEETWYILNNYLTGVESTWTYLTEMKETFAQQDQPIVLVLFGDHKPWMGDGDSGYEEMGIDLSRNSTESFLNYYTTDYMIWANDAAKQVTGNDFTGDGPAVSTCYLMNLIFEQCGWGGPSWMKLSENVMESLPVVSSNGVCMVDGVLVPTDSLGTDLAQKLQAMEKVQNYLQYDYIK